MTTTADTPLDGLTLPGQGGGAVLSQHLPGDGDPGAVLADAARLQAVAQDAERLLLVRAVQWADTHPAIEGAPAAFGDHAAGVLPGVDWAAPAEFAAALGITTAAGERMIHEALELRHRCPMVWSQVIAGTVPAWRARRVAAATIGYPDDVAVYIDAHVWPVVAKIGVTGLDKLLDEAMLRLHPEEREAERTAALDRRQVKLLQDITGAGIASILIRADLTDALEFDHTITALAAALAKSGCEESLDVRRSLAVGILADPEQALTLLTGNTDTDDSEQPGQTGRSQDTGLTPAHRSRKQLKLVVHLSADAVNGGGTCGHCGAPTATGEHTAVAPFGSVARLEHGDRPVPTAMIAQWASREDTAITVHPVLDLANHQATNAYEAPDRLKAQVDTVAGNCCVFPYCTRPARACDHDHVIPHAAGGATCSCQLAPLCRRHHRLKTHTGWTYLALGAGEWVWCSPHGHTFHRDETGTTNHTRHEYLPATDGCYYTQAPDPPGHGPPGQDPGQTPWRLRILRHIEERIAETDRYNGWPIHDPDFDPSRDLNPHEQDDLTDQTAPTPADEAARTPHDPPF